jgi:hypothetical protein
MINGEHENDPTINLINSINEINTINQNIKTFARRAVNLQNQIEYQD